MDQQASNGSENRQPDPKASGIVKRPFPDRPALKEKNGDRLQPLQSSAEGAQKASSAPRYKFLKSTPPPTRLHSWQFPLIGERFLSAHAFFLDCNRSSVHYSAYHMKRAEDSRDKLVAECELKSCPVRCAASYDRVSATWIVTKEAWCAVHRHGDWESSSDLTEGAHGIGYGQHRSLEAYRAAFPGSCPVIPSLPQPGALFPSVNALLFTLRTTIVPQIGISLRKTASGRFHKLFCNHAARSSSAWGSSCPFRVVCEPAGGGQWRVGRSSCWEHRHGPDRRVVEDPTWRPLAQGGKPYDEQAELKELAMIYDPSLRPPPPPRRQLPVFQLSSSVFSGLKRSNPALSSSSCSSDSSGWSSEEENTFVATITEDRHRGFPLAPPPPVRPSLAQSSSTLSNSTSSCSSDNGTSSDSSGSSDSSDSSASLTAEPLPSRAPSAAPIPIPTPSTAPFPDQLTSLLTSLSPSLTSLAPSLLSAGITDLSLLVRFVVLDDESRERMLKDAEVGVLERSRIFIGVAEARERGWTVEKAGERPRKARRTI